nr:Kelch repeat type 1 domain containing protein [Haemonchus contortus]
MELARSLLTGSDVEDVFEFESEIHNRSLVAKLAELRDGCRFCDVTLVAENDLILQFSTLECSNVKEKRTRARGAAAEVIYVVGGCGEKSVERLDLEDAHPVWQYVAPLKLFRYNIVPICAYHLEKGSRYDPVTDQWMSDVPPCPTGRFLLDVTAIDDHFYAIGGCMALYGESVDIVER